MSYFPNQPPAVVTAAAFTRPANTTAYALGQLIANSTTAGSVTPVSFAFTNRTVNQPGILLRCRLTKSNTVITNAIFRLHLYTVLPTVTNGDGGVWLSTQSASYIGSMDITVDKSMSDGAVGVGIPTYGSLMEFVPVGQTIYGLLEARAPYTPTSGETFALTLEAQ